MGQKTQFVDIQWFGWVGGQHAVPLRGSHDQTGHPTEMIRAKKKAHVVAIPPSR
jgi:hypothetical protein